MINSGTEVQGKVGGLSVQGPISVFQGYGQLTLDKVLPLDVNSSLKLWIHDEKAGLNTMETFKRCFRVPESAEGKELRTSLVWTDPPAALGAFFALVNNLDLSLSHVESGKIFLGNGLFYTDTQGENHAEWDILNNVEQVRLSSSSAGYYLLQVHGTHVPQGPQSFATVINGVFEPVDLSFCSSLSMILPHYEFFTNFVISLPKKLFYQWKMCRWIL
jgi:hypothetical protein